MHRVTPSILSLLTVGLAVAASAAPSPPTVLDPNPYAVVRAESVAPFFLAAEIRRVDMAIIGDSNTRSAGVSGHEDGQARGFSAALGCYATRVDPVGGSGGWGTTIFDSFSYLVGFRVHGAPAPIVAQLGSFPQGGGFPETYAFLGTTDLVPSWNNIGLGILRDHPMDITGPLRCHLTYYYIPASASAAHGYISPSIRELWPGSAEVVYASAIEFTSGTEAPGLVDWSLDAPPGERSEHGLLFCLTNYAAGNGAHGPFYAQWTRAENTSRSSGIAYSPLLYQGGRTARDAAISLLDGTDQSQMTEWFRQVTRLQNGPPMLLVQIMHGGNDANGPVPAVVYERGMPTPPPGQLWPAGAPTNTAEGTRQNFQSVINRMRDYWVGAGHDEANLFFIIGGYFPQPSYWNETAPGAADGRQWVFTQHEASQAWRQICLSNENVAMIDGYHLSTPEEFTANEWYADSAHPGGDQAHLAVAGYRAWGAACAQAVLRAIECGPSADINFDGDRNITDVFDFLAAWFAGEDLANFDGIGDEPAAPDIFAFLNSWFAGCAGH